MSHSPIRIPLRSPQHTALGYRTVFFPFRHTRSTIHIAFRYPTSGHRDALGVSHRDNTDDLIRIANISRRPLLSNGLASSLYSPDFTSATLQGALLVRRDRVNPLTFGRLRFMIFFLVFPSFFPWLYGSDISFNGVFSLSRQLPPCSGGVDSAPDMIDLAFHSSSTVMIFCWPGTITRCSKSSTGVSVFASHLRFNLLPFRLFAKMHLIDSGTMRGGLFLDRMEQQKQKTLPECPTSSGQQPLSLDFHLSTETLRPTLL